MTLPTAASVRIAILHPRRMKASQGTGNTCVLGQVALGLSPRVQKRSLNYSFLLRELCTHLDIVVSQRLPRLLSQQRSPLYQISDFFSKGP